MPFYMSLVKRVKSHTPFHRGTVRGHAYKKADSNARLTPKKIFMNRKEEDLMAKDGTSRGGRRIKAAHKSDALADKISKGQKATHLEFPHGCNRYPGRKAPFISQQSSRKTHQGHFGLRTRVLL